MSKKESAQKLAKKDQKPVVPKLTQKELFEQKLKELRKRREHG